MPYIRNLAKRCAMGVFAVAVAVAGAGFAQELDPTGDWDIEVDMGGSPMEASLTIRKNDDGSYSGTLNSPMGELTLESVTYVPGKSLSFNETIGEGETAMEFKFEGTFSGPDNFEGTLESSMGPMQIKGTRAEEVSPIAGTWKITAESQIGTLKRDLVVYKSGKAKYVTEEQSFTVKNLAVEENAVTFDVTLEFQGQELPLAFEGTYDGDSLTGEFLSEGSAVAQVTGTKAPAEGSDGGSPVEKPLSVPSDSKARYYVLQKSGAGAERTILTKRVGSSGTSYSRRLYNCTNNTVKYLADGDTLEALARSKPDPRMGPVVEGSIAYYIGIEACK